MPAPARHHSQLISPPQHTYSTIICLVLAIVLSAPVVGVRMYTRQYISRKLWWDDCRFRGRTQPPYLSYAESQVGTCLLGWLFLVAFAALLLQSLQYGGGSDLWNVSKANYKLFRKVSSTLT